MIQQPSHPAQRGVTLIELAFAVLIFAFLVAGIYQGWAIMSQNAKIEQANRELMAVVDGARKLLAGRTPFRDNDTPLTTAMIEGDLMPRNMIIYEAGNRPPPPTSLADQQVDARARNAFNMVVRLRGHSSTGNQPTRFALQFPTEGKNCASFLRSIGASNPANWDDMNLTELRVRADTTPWYSGGTLYTRANVPSAEAITTACQTARAADTVIIYFVFNV